MIISVLLWFIVCELIYFLFIKLCALITKEFYAYVWFNAILYTLWFLSLALFHSQRAPVVNCFSLTVRLFFFFAILRLNINLYQLLLILYINLFRGPEFDTDELRWGRGTQKMDLGDVKEIDSSVQGINTHDHWLWNVSWQKVKTLWEGGGNERKAY